MITLHKVKWIRGYKGTILSEGYVSLAVEDDNKRDGKKETVLYESDKEFHRERPDLAKKTLKERGLIK